MCDVGHLTLTFTTFGNPNHQGDRVRKKGLGEENRSQRWNHHEWKQNLYKGNERREASLYHAKIQGDDHWQTRKQALLT